MRYSVESWAPEYGTALDIETQEPSAPVDVNVEVPVREWGPRAAPDGASAAKILFVDGVLRIDARVWIATAERSTRLGICATYAAGIVCCDGRASVVDTEVRRGLFTAAMDDAVPLVTRHAEYRPMGAAGDTVEQLRLALAQRMGELEVEMAGRCGPADLIVVDGPLSGRQNVPGAIGYVKTHKVSYLPPIVEDVVGALRAGERTPMFLTTTSWSRYSWYLKLPGAEGHPWAGVVRCEADADLSCDAAARLADSSARELPRFASSPHKDPRAPQNLYPIAGLERELRRRSGDAQLLYRGLRESAARASA